MLYNVMNKTHWEQSLLAILLTSHLWKLARTTKKMIEKNEELYLSGNCIHCFKNIEIPSGPNTVHNSSLLPGDLIHYHIASFRHLSSWFLSPPASPFTANDAISFHCTTHFVGARSSWSFYLRTVDVFSSVSSSAPIEQQAVSAGGFSRRAELSF